MNTLSAPSQTNSLSSSLSSLLPCIVYFLSFGCPSLLTTTHHMLLYLAILLSFPPFSHLTTSVLNYPHFSDDFGKNRGVHSCSKNFKFPPQFLFLFPQLPAAKWQMFWNEGSKISLWSSLLQIHTCFSMFTPVPIIYQPLIPFLSVCLIWKGVLCSSYLYRQESDC